MIKRPTKMIIEGKTITIIETKLKIFEKQLAILTKENAQLRKENAELRAKLKMVLALLEEKSINKDSHNSHNAPSHDKAISGNQSLRKKTEKKSGGHVGHKGHTLKMTQTPDEIHELKREYCSICGKVLLSIKET